MRNTTGISTFRALFVLAALCCAGVLWTNMWVWDAVPTSETLSDKAFQVMALDKDPTGRISGNQVLGTPLMEKEHRPAADSAIYKIDIPADGIYYSGRACDGAVDGETPFTSSRRGRRGLYLAAMAPTCSELSSQPGSCAKITIDSNLSRGNCDKKQVSGVYL